MSGLSKAVTITVFITALALSGAGGCDSTAGTSCARFGEHAQRTTSDHHHYTCTRTGSGLVWLRDY